ncbi:MAG: glycosyltransferase [Bacteroidota bacterium]
MRLLFVADGRSPIALNWIRYFVEGGDEVHLVSTFACEPDLPLKGLEILPVAFSGLKKPRSAAQPAASASAALGLRTGLRQWLGPLTIPRAAHQLRRLIQRIQPDLVHALRIPYEGMLAAEAYAGIPLVVSVWGNDFTLHGLSTPLMRHYTQWTMEVADALHADCRRDIRLARQWGLAAGKPTLVIPGNGGIRLDRFHPPAEPVSEPVLLNPRGFRAYVRNDVFFQAIPRVLEKRPEARFMCCAMAGDPRPLGWIRELRIEHAVELLPLVEPQRMADVFRSAQVVVSPSVHDGTPNSLLEGMACGCLPVAGDLESIREWISPGQNGLLFDARDARSTASAMLAALENENLRVKAAGFNREMLSSRAEYGACMSQAQAFYERVIRAPG